jgi:hypothetical protein
MANEHYRNFSHKGSRTVVPAKIVEIELLVWSQKSKDRSLRQLLRFSRQSEDPVGAAEGCDLLTVAQRASKKDVWW